MNLRFLLSFAAPWRWTLALCAALMIGQSAASLAVPWLAGRFAGGLLGGGAPPGGLLLVGLLVLFALQAVLSFFNQRLLGGASAAILADLRTRLYDHLQALPLPYFQQRKQGEVLALLTSDVEVLADFLSGTLLSLPSLLLTLLGAMVLMGQIDLRITLLVALAVPVFFLVMKILGRRLRTLSRELQQTQAEAVGIAEENLGLLPAIKSFVREPLESQRYGQKVAHLRHLTTQQVRVYAALGPSIQFLAAAAMVLVLWLLNSVADNRSPSEMVSFLLYAAMLTSPVGALADIYGQTRQAQGALTRLGEVLDEPAEPHTGATLPPVQGRIELADVHFAYPGRPVALQGITLHIGAGETVALTGPNGAGKSTLSHLLMRLIRPTQGRILIDGHDIDGVSLSSLRGQIGIVPQHVLLSHGTVRDNIAWGLPGASLEAVETAARAAQAHEFVSRLPDGYDTWIGDQGIRLSGGQRQRIALARALLTNPPILILDEATAMFDPESERSFIADCHDTLRQRTVLLITHRPASLALADRIVRLEDGRVASDIRTSDCNHAGAQPSTSPTAPGESPPPTRGPHAPH